MPFVFVIRYLIDIIGQNYMYITLASLMALPMRVLVLIHREVIIAS